MTLIVAPSATVEATVTGFPTGLVGTLGVRIMDNQGGTTIARTTVGIVETPAASGVYAATFTAPADVGQYTIVWDAGVVTPDATAAEDLVVITGGLAATQQTSGVKHEPFDVGDEVTFYADFVDAAGQPADPTTVTLKVKDPSGAETEYTAGQLTNPTVGRYERAVVVDASGRWHYAFRGTGSVQIAVEKTVQVRSSSLSYP